MTLLFVVAEHVLELMQDIGDFIEEFGSFAQIAMLIRPYGIEDKENASNLKIHDGTIQFHNVGFQYGHATPLFSMKDMTIKGGQKVGLVDFLDLVNLLA